MREHMLQLCKINVLMLREREWVSKLRRRGTFSFHIDYFLPGQKSSRDPLQHWGGGGVKRIWRWGKTDMMFHHLQHWLASINADCQNTVTNVKNKQINQTRQPKVTGCLLSGCCQAVVCLIKSVWKYSIHKSWFHSDEPSGHELSRAVGETQV